MALRTRNGGSQTPDYWLKLARNTQYDIRTSEKAATTLETLTGVNRTIWLAEQYKNYGRIQTDTDRLRVFQTVRDAVF